MSAKYEDARAGWEIYLNSSFGLSHGDVNDRLASLGFTPIADRTWKHYQRLRRGGFRRYISINRLDTMNVPDPYVDESIRNRYRSHAARVPAQLVIHRLDGLVEVVGVADSLSEFGTEIVVTSADEVEALTACAFEVKTPVTVHFLDPSATVYGHLDYVSAVEPGVVRISVVFQRLLPIVQFASRQTLENGRFLFVVGTADSKPSLGEVSQDIYWLFNLIEASRAIVNDLLGAYGSGDLYVLPPTVDSLRVASPVTTWIAMNVTVFQAIEQALARLEDTVGRGGKVVRAWTRADVYSAEAEKIRAQADLIRADAEHRRVSTAERQLVLDATTTFVQEIVKPAITMAGRELREHPDFNFDSIAKLVLDDLVPALTEMRSRGLTAAPEAIDVTSTDSD